MQHKNLPIVSSSSLMHRTLAGDLPGYVELPDDKASEDQPDLTVRKEWRAKLSKLGCNKICLNVVMEANVIKDYQTLYDAVSRLREGDERAFLSPWELFCMSGEIPAIQYAAKHCDIGVSKGHYKASPVHFAALSGSPSVMRYLVNELKFSPDGLDSSYHTIVHSATRSGSLEAIKCAVKLSPTGIEGKHANKVLSFAAIANSKKSVDCLVKEFKIDPLAPSKEGHTALHFAAWNGLVEMMEYLIHVYKLKPSTLCNDGMDALHYAARGGSEKAVSYLLQLNADYRLGLDPNKKDKTDRTAFTWASRYPRVITALQKVYVPSPKSKQAALNLGLFGQDPEIIAEVDMDLDALRDALKNSVVMNRSEVDGAQSNKSKIPLSAKNLSESFLVKQSLNESKNQVVIARKTGYSSEEEDLIPMLLGRVFVRAGFASSLVSFDQSEGCVVVEGVSKGAVSVIVGPGVFLEKPKGGGCVVS